MHVLLSRIDGVLSTQATYDGQLLVVHIAGNDLGTTHDGTHHSAYAYHTTANHHDGIGIDHLCTADSVETHRHGFDDSGMLYGDVADGDDFLPGYGDIFAHGTVALNT